MVAGLGGYLLAGGRWPEGEEGEVGEHLGTPGRMHLSLRPFSPSMLKLLHQYLKQGNIELMDNFL